MPLLANFHSAEGARQDAGEDINGLTHARSCILQYQLASHDTPMVQ